MRAPLLRLDWLGTIALGLLMGACGVADTTDGTTTSGPPASNDARCVGKPVEAYTVDDRESCTAQGSDWDSTNLECRGTTFSVHCSRADESQLPSEVQRQMCLDMPGCGYTEADGSITYPTGHCEGQKTPCESLDETGCGAQTGCFYFTSDGCTDKNGSTWLDNAGCAELQIDTNVSFSVVRSACQRAVGCTWVD